MEARTPSKYSQTFRKRVLQREGNTWCKVEFLVYIATMIGQPGTYLLQLLRLEVFLPVSHVTRLVAFAVSSLIRPFCCVKRWPGNTSRTLSYTNCAQPSHEGGKVSVTELESGESTWCWAAIVVFVVAFTIPQSTWNLYEIIN